MDCQPEAVLPGGPILGGNHQRAWSLFGLTVKSFASCMVLFEFVFHSTRHTLVSMWVSHSIRITVLKQGHGQCFFLEDPA